MSLPPTLRSNYRLFNLVKVQVLSKKYKDNFFSEALQMRNCTTRQLSYRSRFVKYYLTKYKVQRKYLKNIPKYTANIKNITKYSKDMTKYSEVYCWAAPAIGICGWFTASLSYTPPSHILPIFRMRFSTILKECYININSLVYEYFQPQAYHWS